MAKASSMTESKTEADLTASGLQDAVSEAMKGHRESLQAQKAELENSLANSLEAFSKLSGRVNGMEDELNRVPKVLEEMQVRACSVCGEITV